VLQDLRDSRDFLVTLVKPGSKDPKVIQEPLGFRVSLEILVTPEHRVHQGLRDRAD